jgi:hypothetical protein
MLFVGPCRDVITGTAWGKLSITTVLSTAVIVPVLKYVARKRLVETVIDLGH